MQAFHQHLVDRFDDYGWVVGYLIRTLNDRDGADVTASALQAARLSRRELNELLILSDRLHSSIPSDPDTILDYATAKSVVDPMHGFPHSWIKTAPITDLKMAADDLMNERDEQRTGHYLQVFVRRDFPYDPSHLFSFIKSKNRRVSHAALRALRRLSHPKIREFALQTISEGKRPDLAIDLLVSNFQSGDLALLEAVFHDVDLDDDAWHGMGMATLELLRSVAVPSDESRMLLLKLYEQTPCSFCRRSFVEELRDAHAVPDWMAYEARFDAEPETAALFTTEQAVNEHGV